MCRSSCVIRGYTSKYVSIPHGFRPLKELETVLAKKTVRFRCLLGGTGAPSDNIVVPQVQVLVNLTGTQWKPVKLGNLH